MLGQSKQHTSETISVHLERGAGGSPHQPRHLWSASQRSLQHGPAMRAQLEAR